jgi:hypothetical protein
MSDTPRTDKAYEGWMLGEQNSSWMEFARELERELRVAKEALNAAPQAPLPQVVCWCSQRPCSYAFCPHR